MNTFQTLMVGTVLLASASAHADNKWNQQNDPANFEKDYLYTFHALPNSGSIEASGRGWADSYWPATRGYILDRWQVPADAFQFKKYALPNPSQVQSMSETDLNLLSPAEKFDIIRGQYDLPIAKNLQKASPTASDWWKGLCNGWTASSLNFTEPKAIIYKSPVTGQSVPLASGDVKALLAFYYGTVDHSPTQYVGTSCRGANKLLSVFNGSCADVNAGAFHVVVSNEMGMRKHGLAMDRDPGSETWNQPYTGFTSTVLNETSNLSPHHSNGTVKEVTVATTMTYVDELYNTTDENLEDDHHVAATVNALGANQPLRTHTYQYTLELDANDSIIGGTWANSSDHPDLIWRQQVNPEIMGTDGNGNSNGWEILKDIVHQANL